jgi:glycine cleavage system H protein
MVTVKDMEFVEDRLYHKEHSWAKEEEGLITVGIDSFSGKAAGKIAHVRVFNPGRKIKMGKSVGTIETSKWVGPIRSPVTGEIKEVNEAVKANPELLNTDPYGSWVFKCEASDWDNEKGELFETPEKIEAWIEEEYEKYKDQFPEE